MRMAFMQATGTTGGHARGRVAGSQSNARRIQAIVVGRTAEHLHAWIEAEGCRRYCDGDLAMIRLKAVLKELSDS